MITFPCPIVDYVPHGPSMSLLDSILEYQQSELIACVTITKDSHFIEAGKVPAWVGIEYMAQTIAAHAGVRARLAGDAVKIGFLVGSRKFESEVDGYELNEELHVQVSSISDAEDRLQVFNCQMTRADPAKTLLATARLNVFMPDDLAEYMEHA